MALRARAPRVAEISTTATYTQSGDSTKATTTITTKTVEEY